MTPDDRDVQPCLFCGGNLAEPDHWRTCDGRQGIVEAAIAAGECYPDAAGWTEPTTSREAAETIDAATVRAEVWRCLLTQGPQTTDECARYLGRSVLTIRPRFSELRAQHLIDDTGMRHVNASGKRAIVWAPVPELVHR